MAAKMAPSTILSLNDDCLYLVLSKFSVQELMNIEKVCRAFKRVAIMVYKTHQVLDFHKITSPGGYPLAPLQAREVAKRLGPYVHTLKASKSSFSMTGRVVPKSVLMQCKNLQKIFLYDLRMIDKWCLRRLSDAFVRIKEVHLVESSFTDEIGECLRKSSQLEVIRFTKNDRITGQCLIGLQGIKEINLMECTQLEPHYFKEFISANLQLRSLNICGCSQIDSACLSLIATKLICLESLEIDGRIQATPEAYCALANLPSLTSAKILEMSLMSFLGNDKIDGFLSELLKKTHNRLEELEVLGMKLSESKLEDLKRFTKLRMLSLASAKPIVDGVLFSLPCKDTLEVLDVSGCDDVTPQGLIKFVGQCRRLRKLVISSCRQYTMDFLVQLASQRDRKLEIWASRSYFSSMACDQIKLPKLLKELEDKIELKYKHLFRDGDEFPRRGSYLISSDQIIFK